jgi:hypothetical protein
MIKNYLLQPSTWIGIAQVAASVGLFTVGLVEPISGGILAIFGVIEVLRKEKIKA